MNNKLRLLSYAVIAYMLLAFAWWTILLNNKNQDAYTAKKELLRLVTQVDGKYTNETEFRQLDRYKTLKERYERRQLMIFGESLVFVISLFIGFWFINKGYREIIRNSRNKTNFLLSISHELKSPVASIKLALETLRRRKTLNAEQVTKITQGGLSETERLKSLIENLLLAARLEDSYQINLEKINARELLDQIIVSEKIRFPEFTIQLDIDSQVEEIITDRFAFSTIMNNLIENALKYSEDQKNILIQLKPDGSSLQVEVADWGIGIPDEEKDKVFEKFYRLGAEITRKTKGTGLGLFIISKMVKALNGKIFIKDNTPRGSVFILKLNNHIAEHE